MLAWEVEKDSRSMLAWDWREIARIFVLLVARECADVARERADVSLVARERADGQALVPWVGAGGGKDTLHALRPNAAKIDVACLVT